MSTLASVTREFVTDLDYEVADFEARVWELLHEPTPVEQDACKSLVGPDMSVAAAVAIYGRISSVAPEDVLRTSQAVILETVERYAAGARAVDEALRAAERERVITMKTFVLGILSLLVPIVALVLAVLLR